MYQMRDLFPGYYPPTADELQKLWGEGLIVLDTNALLHLFRYTEETRKQFLQVLTDLQKNLWIPYQVASEFQVRRLDVIADQGKAYDKVGDAIDSAGTGVRTALDSFRHHPVLDKEEITKEVEQRLAALKSILQSSRQEFQAQQDSGMYDAIFAEVSDLFLGRVGDSIKPDDVTALHETAKQRYENKIPPGYMDAKTKGEPERYGDYVLWEQLLRHGEATDKPAIFITDDQKEDWWWRKSGKTLGPRVELVQEYFDRTGKRVHLYAPERFLQLAKERGIGSITEDALIEVGELSRSNQYVDTNELLAQRADLADVRRDLLERLERLEGRMRMKPSLEEVGGRRARIEELRKRLTADESRLGETMSSAEVDELFERMARNERELRNREAEFDEFKRTSSRGSASDLVEQRHLWEELRFVDDRIDELDRFFNK
jgi:hypothetical protein